MQKCADAVEKVYTPVNHVWLKMPQCLSKIVAEITDPLQEQTMNDSSGSDFFYSDTLYLDTVNGHNEKHWCVEVLIENNPVTFKMDTGAEVTALSDTTFHSLKNPELQLKKLNQTLCGPNRSPLDVLGEVTLKLTYKDKSSQERVFIIHNLLGLTSHQDT